MESKFLAKWQGPYKILKKVGEVNYKVYQLDKWKKKQTYHVHLFKAWKEREAILDLGDKPLKKV